MSHKIAVTGALGHIGSAFVRDYARSNEGSEIVMIDNLATMRFCSLFDLPASAQFRFLEQDITSDGDWIEHIVDCEFVLHLAALTDAAGSFGRYAELEKINLAGTKKMSSICLELGVPFIFASSTSVYGSQKKLVDETCTEDELLPQSPYAEIKLREEQLLRLQFQKGLRGLILRLGTIAGVSPGMRFHTAVNKFCLQASLGNPISVWSTALDQKRPYLHINDFCEAIQFIQEKDLFDGEIYNLLSQNLTVRDLIETLNTEVSGVTVEYVDHKIMNQLSYEVSMKKLEGCGYKTTHAISDAIHDTLSKIDGLRFKR